MGCDIHLVLEQFDAYEDEWVGRHSYEYLEGAALNVVTVNHDRITEPLNYVSYKLRQRDYALFGELANVRGSGSKERTPKGLPDDASSLTRMVAREWGEDGHSHSYLSLREFIECVAIARDEISELLAERINAQDLTQRQLYLKIALELTGMEGVSDYIDNLRIVFWFDN